MRITPCPAVLRRPPTTVSLAFTLAFSAALVCAEELPFTRNVPIPEFQNRTQDMHQYDFDAPPEGMFRSIVLSESFEEELGSQRTHEIVPVRPTEQFPSDSAPVFIVFKLHQHYQAFQLFGLCYPEDVSGLDRDTLVSQDAMYVALEDDTGYLKLLAPQEGWKPGRYKVLIHAGEQVNEMTLMGTMRFTIAGMPTSSASSMAPRP
ncbi:MAG: hypothetical protein AB7G68_10195 [Nitrospiraceae bacterium]